MYPAPRSGYEEYLHQHNISLNKSHFCYGKPLFSSFALLFTHRLNVVNQTASSLKNYIRQSNFSPYLKQVMAARHSQGSPLPGSTTSRIHHSQGPPLPGSATLSVCHSQIRPKFRPPHLVSQPPT